LPDRSREIKIQGVIVLTAFPDFIIVIIVIIIISVIIRIITVVIIVTDF